MCGGSYPKQNVSPPVHIPEEPKISNHVHK